MALAYTEAGKNNGAQGTLFNSGDAEALSIRILQETGWWISPSSLRSDPSAGILLLHSEWATRSQLAQWE